MAAFPAEPLSGYLQQNKDTARHQRSRPRVDLCQGKALLRHHACPPLQGDTEMSLCSCRCFHRAFVALTWPWKVCAIQSSALIAGYLRPPPSPLWCLEMDVVKRNLLSKDKKNPLFTGKIGFTQYSSVLQWPAWFLGKFFILNTYHYPTRIATQALTSGFTVKVILLVLLYLKYIILIHQGVTDPLASDHKYTQIRKKNMLWISQALSDPDIYLLLCHADIKPSEWCDGAVTLPGYDALSREKVGRCWLFTHSLSQ